jgi:16S rRNA (cytosine967-C5)-methyltransferase
VRDRPVSVARAAAVGALRDVFDRERPWSTAVAERTTELSAADGDLAREIVLGVLRTRSLLDRELSAVCRVPLRRLAPGLREILEVALYQLRRLERVPPHAAVDEAVRLARASAGEGGAKLVNAVLRSALRTQQPDEPPPDAGQTPAELAVRFSHPEFLVSRWLSRFGAGETRAILEIDNASSGLDLMANPRRTTREALARALAQDGIPTKLSPIAPLGLTVVSGNPLRSPLFGQGHFWIQDLGSQTLVELLPEGDILVDLAAAPGGKSFAAMALGRARRTVALDRSPARLLRVRENVRRLGFGEVRPAAANVLAPPLAKGSFDRVLLDAPCSGTGTLRKNPDIRYRVTPEAILRLAGIQEEALSAAAGLLAPGGFLLYSTCSLELEENERVVERVLSRLPTLEAAGIDAPSPLRPFVSGNRFRLPPGPDNDGFVAHLLRRRA